MDRIGTFLENSFIKWVFFSFVFITSTRLAQVSKLSQMLKNAIKSFSVNTLIAAHISMVSSLYENSEQFYFKFLF